MSRLSPHITPDLSNRHCPMHTNTALMILMSLGVDIEQVEVLAEGESENYKGEIREQQPKPGEPLGPNDRVVLRVGRYGAFDQLPYQFFYGLDTSPGARPVGWEERARRLMATFDSGVIRRLARADFEQLRFQFGFAEREHLSRFLDLFGFSDRAVSESVDETLLWVTLMPYFNEWAGNPERVAQALALVFGYPFEINESIPRTHAIPPSLQCQLGSPDSRLGQDTVCGESFTDRDSAYRVTIKRVRAVDVRQFLPGQPKRVKLEKILGICMPSHLEYEIEVQPLHRVGQLGEENAGAYLGYSAFA